jgi:hypothetical protein
VSGRLAIFRHFPSELTENVDVSRLVHVVGEGIWYLVKDRYFKIDLFIILKVASPVAHEFFVSSICFTRYHAAVIFYPADSSLSPAAFFLLLCVVGCCVVVLDTRLG